MKFKKPYDETKGFEREYLFLKSRSDRLGMPKVEFEYCQRMTLRALGALNLSRRKAGLPPYGEQPEEKPDYQAKDRNYYHRYDNGDPYEYGED
jgi:hypothetical protein